MPLFITTTQGGHFALGDEVIQNEVGPALVDPALLVFPVAVLEVEHRVGLGIVLHVAGRGVDQAAFQQAYRRGKVVILGDGAVGHVLAQVEIHPGLGDVHVVDGPGGAIAHRRQGVEHLHAVHVEQDGDKAAVPSVDFRGPQAVLALLQVVVLPVAEHGVHFGGGGRQEVQAELAALQQHGAGRHHGVAVGEGVGARGTAHGQLGLKGNGGVVVGAVERRGRKLF